MGDTKECSYLGNDNDVDKTDGLMLKEKARDRRQK